MNLMIYKIIGTNIGSYIYSVNNKKIFGIQSFKSISFQHNGLLHIQLSSKTILLTQSSFILGISTKFNTRNIGRVSSVRGISKNPVDHPNGGRANTKGSFKTP